MADDTDVLLKMFEEESVTLRHIETQRSTFSYILVLIFIALIALIGQIGLNFNSLLLAISLIILGIFGTIFSTKFHERWDYHRKRRHEFRLGLDDLHPNTELMKRLNRANNNHKTEWKGYKFNLSKFRLYKLWMVFYSLMIVIGFFIVVLISFF
jgi:hypothetical protein